LLLVTYLASAAVAETVVLATVAQARISVENCILVVVYENIG
jgi:hypothetical protein